MIDGHAVTRGACAAAVVADHTAQRGAIRRGGIGRKEKFVCGSSAVQIVLHHTGLHTRRECLRIERADLVHEAREVDYHGPADRLSTEPCTGAARKHGYIVLGRDLDGCDYIVRITWVDHADRFDSVDA